MSHIAARAMGKMNNNKSLLMKNGTGEADESVTTMGRE